MRNGPRSKNCHSGLGILVLRKLRNTWVLPFIVTHVTWGEIIDRLEQFSVNRARNYYGANLIGRRGRANVARARGEFESQPCYGGHSPVGERLYEG